MDTHTTENNAGPLGVGRANLMCVISVISPNQGVTGVTDDDEPGQERNESRWLCSARLGFTSAVD
jgi:hypothetical protein